MLHDADRMPNRCGLERSAALMHHRGPDRHGIYVDEGIGLVHTRLSLLDLHRKTNGLSGGGGAVSTALLSQRKKQGFAINAHSRMEIANEFFADSLVANIFELDRRAMRHWAKYATREVKRRLLHLEVWAHVCLHDAARDTILAKLRKHVRVRPPDHRLFRLLSWT
jgi:hypothetical protein